MILLLCLVSAPAEAQLFDFDNAPIHTSLPLDLTAGGLTAHFSATGQGFSVQPADAMGFTPVGFGGLCIYPNSVFAADLQIDFSSPLSDFSIMYAPQELGCDDSAIMRVTAYRDGLLKGSSTTTAPSPGTWPTGTLSYSNPAGFNRVVVHYDQRPLCTDYGPIFMADNMNVTVSLVSVPMGEVMEGWIAAPNPFRGTTELRLRLARTERLTVTVHDSAGRLVRSLIRNAVVGAGSKTIEWDGRDDDADEVASGVYFCRITSDRGTSTSRMILRLQ